MFLGHDLICLIASSGKVVPGQSDIAVLEQTISFMRFGQLKATTSVLRMSSSFSPQSSHALTHFTRILNVGKHQCCRWEPRKVTSDLHVCPPGEQDSAEYLSFAQGPLLCIEIYCVLFGYASYAKQRLTFGIPCACVLRFSWVGGSKEESAAKSVLVAVGTWEPGETTWKDQPLGICGWYPFTTCFRSFRSRAVPQRSIAFAVTWPNRWVRLAGSFPPAVTSLISLRSLWASGQWFLLSSLPKAPRRSTR